MPTLEPDPSVGQVLGETYRLTRLIGAGGMGKVYEAVHLRLARKRVAVKLLQPGAAVDPAIYARFRREAEIATALGHPNIIEVLDFNVSGEGQPYIVMELLAGIDLQQLLAMRGALARAEVSAILRQVGSALQAAHARKIIHRDLKPENIFLSGEPRPPFRVKLLDFGLSKIKDSQSKLTQDHSIFGTPYYMSPEQADGCVNDLDQRTDIFSATVVAYQCLSGTLPFDGPSVPGILYQVCHGEPPPLVGRVPQLPPDVDLVLQRGLAKRAEDRYERIEYLVEDLCAALEARPPGHLLRALGMPDPEKTLPVELVDPAEPEPRGRRRVWTVLLATLLLGLAGALAVVTARWAPADLPTPLGARASDGWRRASAPDGVRATVDASVDRPQPARRESGIGDAVPAGKAPEAGAQEPLEGKKLGARKEKKKKKKKRGKLLYDAL